MPAPKWIIHEEMLWNTIHLTRILSHNEFGLKPIMISSAGENLIKLIGWKGTPMTLELFRARAPIDPEMKRMQEDQKWLGLGTSSEEGVLS